MVDSLWMALLYSTLLTCAILPLELSASYPVPDHIKPVALRDCLRTAKGYTEIRVCVKCHRSKRKVVLSFNAGVIERV